MNKYDHTKGRTQGERYTLMMLEELEQLNKKLDMLLFNKNTNQEEVKAEIKTFSDSPKEPVQKKPRKKKTE